MRIPVRMVEKEDVDREDVKKLVENVVKELSDYLKEYIPEKRSYSKHSVMGPVGKLISVLESGRFENSEALLGYVINVHNNTSKRKISAEGIEHLKKALELLEELKTKVNIRIWIRLMREIDYAVYKNKMEQIVLGGEKNEN